MQNLQHKIENVFPFIIGIVYFIFRPVTSGSSHDALDYVLNVMGYNDDDWFNPHHLAFEATHKAILDILSVFGINPEPILAMQVVTIIFSMISIYIVILILKQLNVDILQRLYCVAMLAATYGFWQYSIVADTYIPALAFNLLALYFFLKIVMTETSYTYLVLLGVAISIAILFQQNYVFLLPVISFAFLLNWLSKRQMMSLRLLMTQNIVMGTACALIVGSAYLGLSFLILGHETIGQSLTWSRGYSNDGLWTEFSVIGSPVKMTMGLAQAIWGLDFVLANSHITKFLPITVTPDELFLVSNELNAYQSILLIAILAVSTLSFVWLATKIIIHGFKSLRNPRPNVHAEKAYMAFFWPFMVIFGLVTLLWEPVNLEFHLQFLPVIFIFAALKLGAIQHQNFVKPALAASLVSLLGITFFGGIKAHTSQDTDYWKYAHADIAQTVTPNDLIILDCKYSCYLNMRYETKSGTTIKPVKGSPTLHLLDYSDDDSINIAKEHVENHSKGRVFISKNIFKNPNFESISDHEQELYTAELNIWYKTLKPFLNALETSELMKEFERHEFYVYSSGKK